MPESKPDRKNNATLTIFSGSDSKNDQVRVGYISTVRGYVQNLSVYQANKYAEQNPGTQFILETRKGVQYLNINQVNNLTNQTIIPKFDSRLLDDNDEYNADNSVPGLLDNVTNIPGGKDRPYPVPTLDSIIQPGANYGVPKITDQSNPDLRRNISKKDSRIIVDIQGGGGVGAAGVPIVGNDGGLLMIYVSHGGFGYKFPPQVRIFDESERGTGVRAFAFLGTQATVEENYYDDEEDFEKYDFTTGPFEFDPEDSNWGQRYSLADQTVIGNWNPSQVLNINRDTSFDRNLKAYLDFLKDFDPNKAWWTTRNEVPVRVIGKNIKKSDQRGRVVYKVEHWRWGGNKSKDDIFEEIEFEVYGQGTVKNKSIFFKFEATDGSHTFRIDGLTHKWTREQEKKDRKNKVVVIKVKANTTYVVTSNEKKRLRDRKGLIEQGLANDFMGTEEDGTSQNQGGTSNVIFADVVGSANDNDDIQVLANAGKFKAGRRTGVRFDTSDITNQDRLFEIEENKNNRFRRGTFELTYRINRRKEISFTENISRSFMNNHAICPTLPSQQAGSDQAGVPYTMIWNEYFPHDGQYTFYAVCDGDNSSMLFLDQEKVMNIPRLKSRREAGQIFKRSSDAIKKKKVDVKKGIHQIRIDLANEIHKKITTTIVSGDGGTQKQGKVNVKFKVEGRGSGRHRKMSALFVNQSDDSDSFKIENSGANRQVREVVRPITPGAKYTVDFTATADVIDNKTETFNIIYKDLNSSNNPINVTGNNRIIKLKDNKGDDTNARFRIISKDPGVDARFSDDGRKIIVKNATKRNQKVTLKLNWDDKPNDRGIAVRSIKIADKTWKVKGREGDVTLDLEVSNKIPQSAEAIIEQGVVENGTKNKEGVGSSNRVFGDYVGSVNDNDDMQIWVNKGGVFTSSNPRQTGPRRRNTFDLDFIFQTEDILSDESIREESISTEIVELERKDVFNTKEFIDKATRPLYRMDPGVGRFGDFFSRYGITPFNPLEVDPTRPDIVNPEPITQPYVKPSVKFRREGGPNGELFMIVKGTGKAKIGFLLDVDDNFITSGLSTREVSIENDSGKNLKLKRYKVSRAIERIKGYAEFTAGKTYKITSTGGSSTSGFKTVDNTIIFDDDINNGWDKNAALKIDYINPIRESYRPNINNSNIALGSPTSSDPISSSDDYAGIHDIVWKDINFPITGNYNVEIQVDDNVNLQIGNQKRGRNYIEINKKGFRGNTGRSTGKSSYTVFIEKGNYTIRAALEQVPGKGITDGNPMGLAIDIKTLYSQVEGEVILRKSWYENPYGVAMIILAPLPPIPNQNIEPQKGMCPTNPLWTTRYKPEEELWIPCNHRYPNGRKSWSRFMNRYAVSPILPLSTPGSGKSGQSWRNKWKVEIPYKGFYSFQSAADNKATVNIIQEPENSQVTAATVQVVNKIDHFGTEKANLTSNKIYLEKGIATIDLTVTNGIQDKRNKVTKKVFNTEDWVNAPKPVEVPIDFNIYGQGSIDNMSIRAVFSEIGGDGGFTINNVAKSNTTETVRKNVKPNTDYKVNFVGARIINPKTILPIRTRGEADDAGRRVGSNGKTLLFDDNISNGFDENAKLKIVSTGPGVSAKFSNDGRELIVSGQGDVSFKFEWDDKPKYKGQSVNTLIIGNDEKESVRFKQKGRKGEVTKTIKILNTVGSNEIEQGTSNVFGRRRNGPESNTPSDVAFGDYVRSTNDNNDMQIKCTSGIFTPSNKRFTKKATRLGSRERVSRGTRDLVYRLDGDRESVAPITEIDGAKYEVRNRELSRTARVGGVFSNTAQVISNPRIATYRNSTLGRLLSPFFPDGTSESGRNLQGRTWEMVWENVDFPIDGDYRIEVEADDILVVQIGNRQYSSFDERGYRNVANASTDEGLKNVIFQTTAGIKDVKLILQNAKIPATSFRENPTYVGCKITCEIEIETPDDRSWRINPTGISAVLLAPPCKKNVGGIGTVERIEITEPGNSFTPPPPGDPGIPVLIEIDRLVPDLPGIGYTTGDIVRIGIGNTAVFLPVSPPTEFGRITRPIIPPAREGTGSGISTDISVTPPPVLLPPITETPTIDIITTTGAGARLTPVYRLTVDPPEADRDDVIQVTDLPGIKQTGYIEGRPYFGEVFLKDGITFAGRYETAGRLIQVYATLQESIDGEVTTIPSAILRQGTDVTNNDPRLNIPGTPDNLV